MHETKNQKKRQNANQTRGAGRVVRQLEVDASRAKRAGVFLVLEFKYIFH